VILNCPTTKNAAKRKRKNALINNSAAGKETPKTIGVKTAPINKVEVVAKTQVKGIDKAVPKIVGPISNVGTTIHDHLEKKVQILKRREETIKDPVRIIRTTPIIRTIAAGEQETTTILEETTPEATILADAPIHVHLSHPEAHKTSKVVVTKATTTRIPPATMMVVEIQRVVAKGTTQGTIKIGINAAGRGNPVWLPLHQGAPPISMEHGNAK
jgi:hypothetical protein